MANSFFPCVLIKRSGALVGDAPRIFVPKRDNDRGVFHKPNKMKAFLCSHRTEARHKLLKHICSYRHDTFYVTQFHRKKWDREMAYFLRSESTEIARAVGFVICLPVCAYQGNLY